MAKDPTNRQTARSPSGQKIAKDRSKPKAFPWTTAIVAGLVVLGAGWGIWSWWQGRQVGSQFDSLVAQGQAALSRVQAQTDYGRSHANPDQALSYATDPPTSGTHWPLWTNAGFYTRPEPKEKLMHSLEHGNVVVYYDKPGQEALTQLRSWAQQFNGQWDGLIVVPKAGIGPTIELTAWNKLLRLDSWDAPSAAAFVDAYRGRGPENQVR